MKHNKRKIEDDLFYLADVESVDDETREICDAINDLNNWLYQHRSSYICPEQRPCFDTVMKTIVRDGYQQTLNRKEGR